MIEHHHSLDTSRETAVRARNRRTALILFSVAVVFFVGIIVRYTLAH